MVPVRRLVDLLVDLEKIFSTDLEDVGYCPGTPVPTENAFHL